MTHHRSHVRTLICGAAAVLAAAVVLAQTALAGTINGDPKDQWPFTRPVASLSPGHAAPVLNADPKDQWPFTRPVASTPGHTVRGLNADPKDEWPFTRSVEAQGRPADLGSGGFSWRDSGIGFLAGLGIALGAAAALPFVRRHRTPRTV
jgi:hypothetical protein